MGQEILGTAAGDQFGFSISMSSNGTVLASGAMSSDYVRVYQYDNMSTWSLKLALVSVDKPGRSLAIQSRCPIVEMCWL